MATLISTPEMGMHPSTTSDTRQSPHMNIVTTVVTSIITNCDHAELCLLYERCYQTYHECAEHGYR